MLLHERAAGAAGKRKRPATRALPYHRLPGVALQNPVQATPPRVLVPMPSKTVLTALDSRSMQLTPNPAFPLTLLFGFGAMPRTAEPSWSRIPSPVPGTEALLFWIVLFPICADDLKMRMLLQGRTYHASDNRMIVGDHHPNSSVRNWICLCVHVPPDNTENFCI